METNQPNQIQPNQTAFNQIFEIIWNIEQRGFVFFFKVTYLINYKGRETVSLKHWLNQTKLTQTKPITTKQNHTQPGHTKLKIKTNWPNQTYLD